MKLNKQFVTKDMGDSQVMVAVGGAAFSGVVRSNRTAAYVVDRLKEDTTEDDIVAAMLKKYDVSEEKARADVRKVLDTLRSIGALDE